MKRNSTLTLCICLLFSLTVSLAGQTTAPQDSVAQEPKDDPFLSFAASINPLVPFFGLWHVSAHVGLGDTISIPIFYTRVGEFFSTGVSMNSVSVGARVYPSKTVHNGFYIGPFLNLTTMSKKDQENSSAFGIGAEIGSMISVGESFFFDIGAGLVRYKISASFADDIPLVLPVFNMLFGYKF